MAHLVPMPPPANYHEPKMTSFSVSTPDGIGQILAWGTNIPGWIWRVGTDTDEQVVSEETPSPYPDLKKFELRGVRQGMKLAIFVYQENSWRRFSPYVDVASNLADSYYAAFSAGTLPTSRYNTRISFYPFGAQQAYRPMSEVDWMNKVEDALGMISRNDVGRAVLRNVKKNLTIYPYIPYAKNAWSDVRINPKTWEGDFNPSSSVDEILLHELIHVIENHGNGYEDRWGFMFDGSDFLTVNATNVYSCIRGRALRKDHHAFQYLPDPHFRNPQLHFEQQSPNYFKAAWSARDLVNTLKDIRGVWNPFSYLDAGQPDYRLGFPV
jgi:hypothetical protein